MRLESLLPLHYHRLTNAAIAWRLSSTSKYVVADRRTRLPPTILSYTLKTALIV